MIFDCMVQVKRQCQTAREQLYNLFASSLQFVFLGNWTLLSAASVLISDGANDVRQFHLWRFVNVAWTPIMTTISSLPANQALTSPAHHLIGTSPSVAIMLKSTCLSSCGYAGDHFDLGSANSTRRLFWSHEPSQTCLNCPDRSRSSR
jgi:hypothetical protein